MSSLVLYRFGYNATVLWTLRVNCIYVARRCLLLEGVNLLLRCPPMLTQASAGNLLERPPTGAHLVAILLNEHCSFALISCNFSPLHFALFHFAVLHFCTFTHTCCCSFALCAACLLYTLRHHALIYIALSLSGAQLARAHLQKLFPVLIALTCTY